MFIIKCKVYCSTYVWIALCHAQIIYIHSTSVGMFRVCYHLGVHAIKSMDMAHLCITNEIFKTPTPKNLAIIMATSRQFLKAYLFKSLASGKGHHLIGSTLKVIMDKFNILAFLNYRDFTSRSKRFFRSGMKTMDSIMALKDHYAFKFVHGGRFLGQSKEKNICF